MRPAVGSTRNDYERRPRRAHESTRDAAEEHGAPRSVSPGAHHQQVQVTRLAGKELLGVAIQEFLAGLDVRVEHRHRRGDLSSNCRRSTSFIDAVGRPPPTASEAGSVRS
jgi:hypothetical protein